MSLETAWFSPGRSTLPITRASDPQPSVDRSTSSDSWRRDAPSLDQMYTISFSEKLALRHMHRWSLNIGTSGLDRFSLRTGRKHKAAKPAPVSSRHR